MDQNTNRNRKSVRYGGRSTIWWLYFSIFAICILFHLYLVAFVFCYICILATCILFCCILSCLYFGIFAFCSICILVHSFLAAIAALLVTMSVGLSVCLSVCYERVSEAYCIQQSYQNVCRNLV